MKRKRYLAEKNWRKLRGFAGLANAIDGVIFVNGEELEQPKHFAAWFETMQQIWRSLFPSASFCIGYLILGHYEKNK